MLNFSRKNKNGALFINSHAKELLHTFVLLHTQYTSKGIGRYLREQKKRKGDGEKKKEQKERGIAYDMAWGGGWGIQRGNGVRENFCMGERKI